MRGYGRNRNKKRNVMSLMNERDDKVRLQRRVERKNSSGYARDKMLDQELRELDMRSQRPNTHGISDNKFSRRVRQTERGDIMNPGRSRWK